MKDAATGKFSSRDEQERTRQFDRDSSGRRPLARRGSSPVKKVTHQLKPRTSRLAARRGRRSDLRRADAVRAEMLWPSAMAGPLDLAGVKSAQVLLFDLN